MVTLPELTSYSEQELEKYCAQRPIFAHYMNLLSRRPTDDFDQLRLLKHQYWLECAFACIRAEFNSEEICRYWTDRTDRILKKAWQICELENENIALFALGKLGSFELNLSSDIDIFFVTQDQSNATTLTPKVKHFIQLLNQTTSFGFCYRVDTNLRPGGELSPLLPSAKTFYNFYDDYLEAWHRLSFIRLRHLLGDNQLGNEIVKSCQKKAFPRHLDFSIVNDIKGIRSKIEYQWRKSNEPFDLKLSPGGIRDIELYIHSLQVIYGGRIQALRISKISMAMSKLSQMDILTSQEYGFLHEFYWQLRQIENFIHIYEDNHTYLLKKNVYESFNIALKERELQNKLERTHNIIGDFFNFKANDLPPSNLTVDKLSDTTNKAIKDIKNLRSHSLRKTQTDQIKNKILDTYLKKTKEIAIDYDLSIQTFRDFIFSIKSKSSIFYLLERHPELLDNLAWLFSISPYVGQVLCRRPELVDSFALGTVDINQNDDTETFIESLFDYKLLGQLVAIIYLFKNNNIADFTLKVSKQAEFINQNLLEFLRRQLGADPVEILCMGKWSGLELGAHSDLDFIFMTEKQPTDKQLKLVRRFINLLTTRSNAGKLYNIDLRLKPNESAGPLLIEKQKLRLFLKKEAQTWQKQAYLRSRIMGTENHFFQSDMDSLWIESKDLPALQEIHHKIYTSRKLKTIDLKTCLGGIVHTEFSLQTQCLIRKRKPKTCSTQDILLSLDIPKELCESLLSQYLFLRKFEQAYQICNASISTKVSQDKNSLQRLKKVLDLEAPFEHLMSVLEQQEKCLKELDLNH